jgi:exonuclease VII small subunit
MGVGCFPQNRKLNKEKSTSYHDFKKRIDSTDSTVQDLDRKDDNVNDVLHVIVKVSNNTRKKLENLIQDLESSDTSVDSKTQTECFPT